MKTYIHPPAKVLACDVDGTLITSVGLSQKVVDLLRAKKATGYQLILWSARGEAYARRVADQFKILDLFDRIISKPGEILDDRGWGWTKYTRIIPLPR